MPGRHPADLFAEHPRAALEYWFFKVNTGETALLVDWIARRRTGERILRASIHSAAGRHVMFGGYDTVDLTETSTRGEVGLLAWDLKMQLGQSVIAPNIFPSRELSIPDLSLTSAPDARLSGEIRHDDLLFRLDGARGMVSHYWGRALARQWWWVHCNQFEGMDVTVECVAMRSGVWGLPVGLPLAYLYLRVGEDQRLWIAPPSGCRVVGTPASFEITFRRIGAPPVRLVGRGAGYGDLGDGIVNTLVGDLDVYDGDRLIARAEGTAGLERRAPS